MDLLIGHISALSYWRTVGPGFLRDWKSRQAATRRAERVIEQREKPRMSEGNRRPAGCILPLSVLVLDAPVRVQTKALVASTWGTALPRTSFVDAGQGFLISTPEFCFLQMASRLSLAQLICLGFELCGTYALHANSPATYRTASLTTVSKLRAFVDKVPNAHGRKKAARALRYVLDGSASPMETMLAMLLCLPHALGGYALPHPLLNQRIDINPSAKKAASKSYCVCDLYWPDARVAVEYDSDLEHTGAERIAKDSKRRNTLFANDVQVVTVTRAQACSGEELNRIANLLAHHLGKRLRYRDPGFTRQHLALAAEFWELVGE